MSTNLAGRMLSIDSENPFLKKTGFHLAIDRCMYKQKKTEGPQKIRKIDPSDELFLPVINDRTYDVKKMQQATRDAHLKICDKLEEGRKIYAEKKADLMKQWNELEEAEISLRNNMLYYNKFVKENTVKRERFHESTKIHAQMAEKYIQEIEHIQKSIPKLENVVTLMKNQISSHRLYQDFLEKIISPTGEFKSLSALISKFELLHETSQETYKNSIAKKVELEKAIREFSKKQFDYENIFHYYMNRLGHIHGEYVDAAAKTNKKDELVTDVKIKTLRKIKEYVNALETMDNMYRSICKRKGVHPCYEKGDYNNQLLVINTDMKFLEKVVRNLFGKHHHHHHHHHIHLHHSMLMSHDEL